MKKLSFISYLLLASFINGQTFIQNYQDRANLVSQNNINTYLQKFELLGIKKTGTTANTNTLNWLKDTYLSLGYQASEIEEHAWTSSGYSSKNLIINKIGKLYPNKFVIVCGHFDSINGPGVNDNGSGTSIILEIARILKNIDTEYSIKFIHFSGEEQGLLGSTKYVSEVVNGTNPKMDIKIVINLDQVGGLKTKSNTKVYCDKDQSSPNSNNAAAALAVQELAKCTTLYSPLAVDFDPAENTDYVPFQQNGEIITGYYEYEGGYDNPYVHTANDVYANMDPVYVYNIGKAAVGAIQHFAVASTNHLATTESPSYLFNNINIYPNPVNDILSVKTNLESEFYLDITDLSSKIIISKIKNPETVDVSKLNPGIYFANFYTENEKISKKFIKQ